MLRNEVLKTLRQTAVILSFLLLIPIIHWANEMRIPGGTSSLGTYFVTGGFLNYLMLVVGLSYMMFSRENDDDAIEYLKTLPVSNRVLFITKTLPRLVVLAVPLLGLTLYETIAEGFQIDTFLLLTVPLGISVAVALIYGFFLGISNRRNPVLIAVVTLLSSYPLLVGTDISLRITRYLVPYIQPEHAGYILLFTTHLFLVVLPALIPLFLLIPIFRSWDMTPGSVRSQAILKKLAIPSILVVVLWGFALPW
jgi:hypothetical protein